MNHSQLEKRLGAWVLDRERKREVKGLVGVLFILYGKKVQY